MLRISIKGFNLKRVRSGKTPKNIATAKQLFVQDFYDYAQLNDPPQTNAKYNAQLVG